MTNATDKKTDITPAARKATAVVLSILGGLILVIIAPFIILLYRAVLGG